MATMAPVPYPTSTPVSFSRPARIEPKGERIATGQPEGLRSLFGVQVCDMGWNEALTYVETISNLRLNARALSFVDGRAALRLAMSAETRRILGNRILLPTGRTLALAARLAQLTPQQFRVLLCLADGLLNKQIAYELGLAENTVKVHVTAILKKLECHSRTQAAVLVKALEPEGDAGGI